MPQTPERPKESSVSFQSLSLFFYNKKNSVTVRGIFRHAGQKTTLKKGSALRRVKDGWFEVEGLNAVFRCPKGDGVDKVKSSDGRFDGLQILVHGQNRPPAFGVAVGLTQAALVGRQKFEQGRRRVAHPAARLHSSRPVVVAAAVGIDAGLPGRFFGIFYYN
jgi:hypothetical protein